MRKENVKVEKKDPKDLESELNSISVFLYSFGLVFIEFLLLDLLLFGGHIKDYRMVFTPALLITFALICLVTIVFMSDKILVNYKDAVLASGFNKFMSMIGIFSIIILAHIFLKQKLFSLSILPILFITAGSFIVGRIIEKVQKNK
ncbi:hypothetical protein [uncultured Helcococcus sp.]|uniref:hypothetical protein n=1 Tax=uncultured Helcococcus sp. TaxID=1072508 RepID=UPI002889CAC0|nr:hypothetical protein [uncultured Helcococcus sp.]